MLAYCCAADIFQLLVDGLVLTMYVHMLVYVLTYACVVHLAAYCRTSSSRVKYVSLIELLFSLTLPTETLYLQEMRSSHAW